VERAHRQPEIAAMIGYMHYNRFGNSGYTDRYKGRAAADVKTCPVCLLAFDARGGTLPGGEVIGDAASWREQVCTQIKDDSVSGGYQAGCLASAYPAA